MLAVPDELQPAFAYEPGQFCTFRVRVGGEPYVRCYSMSSTPAVDAELQVTVKRVPGGVVSNWMIDHLGPGDEIEAAPPAGFFHLAADDSNVVAFAAGSGITPVFSLVKTALAARSRRVSVLYANRDRGSVIFGTQLDALVEQNGDYLAVVHHLDVEQGFVDASSIGAFLAGAGAGTDASGAQFYVCGPGPFMDLVEKTLLALGAEGQRIHIERFTPLEHDAAPGPPVRAAAPTRVTMSSAVAPTPPTITRARRFYRPLVRWACRHPSRASPAVARRAWPGSSKAPHPCSSTTRSPPTRWPTAGC